MKIAIIGPYYRPLLSGIEKIMDMQARLLSARGHEVLVLTSKLRFPDGTFDVPERETIDGVAVRRLHVARRRPPWPMSYPSNGGWRIDGLAQALREFAPDIVHAHNIGAPAWADGAAAYARDAGKPFFYSSYHHPDTLRLDTLRKLVLRRLNRHPLRDAARVYHLTRSDFDKLLIDYPDAQADTFAVLSAGISAPLEQLRGVPHGTNLLFVGRVDDARKGFSVLEKAYDRLRAQHGDAAPTLAVVGAVGEETRARLSAKYGSTIDLAGIVDEAELERRYASAGVFVMPSYYEGFGMPYIEAMRYGVPVVGTRVGGIPEVVPEETGLLVPPGDADALAAALTQLIANPALRYELGTAGRSWSERFHWPRIVDQLEADYIAAAEVKR
ncbi:glycosyltransferase family 4 protein [uncultured Sphingomonas sp.]|uniref:glycosyltransferase family 4 protein n=1 Tax=uncultured Sphingomonas sp. TaxID=158754 RepID=UPI0025D05163|nr:glycosyltransferase family 4 protein [uncultured Sphingomonas sp.]